MLRKVLRTKGASIAISSVMVMQTLAFMSAGVSADATNDEKIENFVKRCYTVTLGREGEADGIAYWKDQLASGKMVGSVLVKNFISSEEYQAKGHTNEGYVNDLYTMFMGRQAESEGAVYWNQQLESGVSRDAVFAGFANSQEFDTLCKESGITAGYFTAEYDINQVNGVNLFVERMYKTCLGRTGDQGGQAYWTQGLLNGSLTGVSCASNFIQSDEYKNLNLSAEDYVKNLYTAFMGRVADESGAKYWVDSLNDGTASRDDVFNGFAYSAEFAKICSDYGIVSGTNTVPAEETPSTPEKNYRIKKSVTTNSDGTKEIEEYSYDKNGDITCVTTDYDKDGKEISKMTAIDGDGTFTVIHKDGSKSVETHSGDGEVYTVYKADGSVDKEESYTTSSKEDSKTGKITTTYTNLNGKVTSTSVYEPVKDGHKTVVYDADGNVTFHIWETRTMNEQLLTVTTEYNLDGSVESYYIAEIRKSDNAAILTFYDAKGNVTGKQVQTGEMREKTEYFDGKGKLLWDDTYSDFKDNSFSKRTKNDYVNNTWSVTEYIMEEF